MVKRLILALLSLCLAQAALAQSFPKPPDVPDYIAPTHTYAAGTTLNVIGDGSATGGTPPAAANELAEVNPVSLAPYTTSSGAQCLTIYEGGTCAEAKVRFLLGGFTHVLRDDPIRNYGRPGTSHLHCFFGNGSTNAYSTYASLRNKGNKSTATGGPLNATGYWAPCMVKTYAGRQYALRNTGAIILYYEIDPATADKTTYFPLGLRYVTGYNMDDADAWLQAKIDAANAQPGTAGRYSLCNGSNCSTLRRWTCVNATFGTTTSDRIANADGSDAFAGKCASGDDFWMQFKGASCWDGINLWSPSGYKHVYPAIWDNVANNFVCANGHYQLPTLQLQIHWPQEGPADRATMRLSSDPVGGIPGQTFHTDWFNGWQRSVLRSWLEYCIGVQNVSPSRECNASAFSATQSLVTSTVITPPASSSDVTKMFKIPNQQGGPITLHTHGNEVLPTLMAEGDSFSACNSSGGADCTGSTTYVQQYAANNSVAFEKSWAIGGSGMTQVEGRQASIIAAKPARGRWIVSLLIGANDLSGVSDVPAYYNRIIAWCNAMRSAGASACVIGTPLQNSAGTSGAIATHNANRAQLRTLLLAVDGTNGVIVADYAGDPIMGPDNSYTANPSYWADVTHPNATGYARLATIYTAAVTLALKA